MVRELFDYNAHTGVLTWRFHEGKARNYYAGKEAGSVIKSRLRTGVSYRKVGVTKPGDPYTRLTIHAHRIAWAHSNGEWPAGHIDHIDGDGLNNSLANLRVVDRSTNARNQHLHATNTSGVAGVVWHKQVGKWQASAGMVCKKTKKRRLAYLGLHDNLLDAAAARKSYDLQHGYGPAHGTTQVQRSAA